MKVKIKFENIFVIVSILFIFGCCVYYGNRLVKYYRIYNPKTETGEKVEIFSATVRQNNPVITEGDGLYMHNGNFVFKGTDVNNYVKYMDKTWRIMEVYRAGSVKLVLDESLAEIVYDKENSSYDKSYMHTFIKDEYNLKLNKNALETMEICLDLVDDTNNMTCENKITDYANSINTSTNTSYINNLDNIWLNNKTTEGLAWNITKGMLTQDNLDFEYSVKPVIILKGTSHSEKGDGTKDNPYIVKDGE